MCNTQQIVQLHNEKIITAGIYLYYSFTVILTTHYNKGHNQNLIWIKPVQNNGTIYNIS